MLDSIALYTAGAAFLGGVVAMLPKRTRRKGAIAAAVGAGVVIAVFAWPASEKRVETKVTKLDDIMPVWQFDERHAIDIAAPPEKVFAAIRGVTANEIFLFRTLTAIRRGGRRSGQNILNAPETKPLLDVATRSGFRYLADDPPHEIVVGSVIERPDVTLATMNFRVTPNANGSTLTTETRVYARTPAAARRFAIYWRIIHPGSDIIRRSWLRAIKRRAEAAP